VANLTLSLDDETLNRARIRAREQGSSVNVVVREFLRSYVGSEDESLALRRFVEVGEGAAAGALSAGRDWTREELYEGRLRSARIAPDDTFSQAAGCACSPNERKTAGALLSAMETGPTVELDILDRLDEAQRD
jgi:plasmid stability protein